MISVDNYKYKSWKDTIGTDIDISEIPIYSKWKDYIGTLSEHGSFRNINHAIVDDIASGKDVYPS